MDMSQVWYLLSYIASMWQKFVNEQERIANGQNARNGEFPFAVGLEINVLYLFYPSYLGYFPSRHLDLPRLQIRPIPSFLKKTERLDTPLAAHP
ncbi:unnamed protein product [Cyprideis torosa]|uniref:Uncharacterized protein n=1 Tax=Cyprideis torosa TaxID=163714 RepID=A0A7R8WHD8_9CRUS|nr:unnamed protein product [Cyprideis torosa]CAG0899242.1 unnamed protein product [Cyprideis torosa]